jgi:hypothetical protein
LGIFFLFFRAPTSDLAYDIQNLAIPQVYEADTNLVGSSHPGSTPRDAAWLRLECIHFVVTLIGQFCAVMNRVSHRIEAGAIIDDPEKAVIAFSWEKGRSLECLTTVCG